MHATHFNEQMSTARHVRVSFTDCLIFGHLTPQRPSAAILHLGVPVLCRGEGVDGLKIVLWSVTCVDLRVLLFPTPIHQTLVDLTTDLEVQPRPRALSLWARLSPVCHFVFRVLRGALEVCQHRFHGQHRYGTLEPRGRYTSQGHFGSPFSKTHNDTHI